MNEKLSAINFSCQLQCFIACFCCPPVVNGISYFIIMSCGNNFLSTRLLPRSTFCLRELLASEAKSPRWWWWSSSSSPSAGVPSKSSPSFSLSIQTTAQTTPHTRSRRGRTACHTPTPQSTPSSTVSWEPASRSPSGKPSHSCSSTRSETAAWHRGPPTRRSSLLQQKKATTTIMALTESDSKIWEEWD